ncbi:MAG: Fe-S cluster assembly protein SufD [Pseudomonadales bacterium]|nr:Fe-S cluster assembly protein SufD [Pseudomonadales bacterium]
MSNTIANNPVNFITAAADLRGQQQSIPDYLQSVRESGITALKNTALPTRKTESWKYTSLYSLTETNYLQQGIAANISVSDLEKFTFANLDVYRLVFVDGKFDEALSDSITEITATVFSKLNSTEIIKNKLNSTFKLEKHFFAQLNSSLLDDGLLIEIPANKKLSKPIHLLQINTEQAENHYSQQRVIITAGAGSQATLIDHRDSMGDSNSIYNNLTEIHLSANANLAHITLQLEAETQVAISGTHIKQSRDSHYQHYLVATGSKIKRNDLQANLTESNTQTTLHGVYLCKHRQHIDNQTAIDHIAAHCNSEETYRGLITDKGKATFNGRIHIHPNAQKTEAHLSNKNLLLSNQAEINTKPELEIYADDVKCSHGATIGQLDERSLFYFQSRGIDRQSAEAMLCFGFINAMVDELPLAAVKDYVADRLAVFFNDVDKLPALWGL